MLANILIFVGTIGFILGYLVRRAFEYRKGIRDRQILDELCAKTISTPNSPYAARDINIGRVKFPGYTVPDNDKDKDNNENDV